MKKPAVKGGRIDWEEVHGRLRRSEALLNEVLTPVRGRVEEVFERRAMQLARRPAGHGTIRVMPLRVMVLRLGEERYGIETKELAEVAPFAGCTPVPGSLPQFLGVIQLRGELRPVASLCRLIGVEESGDPVSSVVVLLRQAGGQIGLRVDGVEDLLEIRPEELVLAAEGKYLKAFIGKLILLDVEAVIKEVYANEESVE